MRERYPESHTLRSDRLLYSGVSELKARHLKRTPALARAVYDQRLHIVRNALGTHMEPDDHEVEFTRGCGRRRWKWKGRRKATRYRVRSAACGQNETFALSLPRRQSTTLRG